MKCLRSASIAIAAAGVLLVGCMAAMNEANSQAKCEVLEETATSLSMRFTNSQGFDHTVNFTRSDANDVWRADVSPYPVSGIVFGRTNPRYASTSQLRALGVTAEQAVGTFDTSITQRPLDDLTIFRTYGRNLVVALWQDNLITEIRYVGVLVNDHLTTNGNGSGPPNTCDEAVEECCNQDEVPNQQWNWPTHYPNPDIDNCLGAVNNCSSEHKNQACNCLVNACQFCDENQAVCDELDLWDMRSAACAAGTNCYEEDDDDPEVHPVVEVLGEILNRIQVIHDMQHQPPDP